jgi:vitamin B12 transporter
VLVSRFASSPPLFFEHGDFHLAPYRGLKITDFMVLRFFIFFFLLSSSHFVEARQQHVNDDTLFYAFDQHVTVTAARLPVELSTAPAATEIYSADMISRLPALTLADILALTPGAAIRNYSGYGGLQLASLRGVGAEYTLVMLDGVRLNDVQNATVDLGKLSLRDIERIEIARGGFASLYGSNALGGVVNILSRSGSRRPALHIGAGSFGWRSVAGSGGIEGSAGRAYIDAGYEQAENDFSVTPSWGGAALRRENASYEKKSLRAGGNLRLGASMLNLYADALDARVGIPGPLFSTSQGKATQQDRRLLLSSRLTQNAGGGILTLGLASRISSQHYHDPLVSFNGIPLDSRFDNRHIQLTSTWDAGLSERMRLVLGMEGSLDMLSSENIRNEPLRRQFASYASGMIQLHAAGGIALHLFPALRLDALHDSPDNRSWTALSPSLGLHLQLLPGVLAVRGRIARSFSAPTFNQLYWLEGGTTDLRAEYSTAFDAGLRLQTATLLEEAEITYFHHDITDKILWMPGSGQWWSPRNIQHVLSSGMESSVGISLFEGNLRLRFGGQWMRATKRNASFPGDVTQHKQLVYVPEFSASLSIVAAFTQTLSFSSTHRAAGRRYYTESNDAWLPPNLTSDISIQYRFDLRDFTLTGKLEVLNLFDTSHEIIAFYPMPGRSVRGILITEF